jgi:hypothetical protein
MTIHPTLKALLDKLANTNYSVRDCAGERMDWVKAGCPIFTPLSREDDWYGLKESGPDPRNVWNREGK